jgi:secondary thiamine-phosphate synthase enzyme
MQTFGVATARREELVDITAQVADALRRTGLRDGAVLVYSPHTTAGVTINEGADPDVRRDMLLHLASLVPQRSDFRHSEGNSDAHIKTSLMGPSQLVPVYDGRLQLGAWQHVYLCEFDGPRRRTVLVQPLAAFSGPEGEGA